MYNISTYSNYRQELKKFAYDCAISQKKLFKQDPVASYAFNETAKLRVLELSEESNDKIYSLVEFEDAVAQKIVNCYRDVIPAFESYEQSAKHAAFIDEIFKKAIDEIVSSGKTTFSCNDIRDFEISFRVIELNHFLNSFDMAVSKVEDEILDYEKFNPKLFRCFEYVFCKLQLSQPSLNQSLLRSPFNLKMKELMFSHNFRIVNTPQKNDVIVYLNSNENPIHYGIFENNEKIKSKWGEINRIFFGNVEQTIYGEQRSGESYIILRGTHSESK